MTHFINRTNFNGEYVLEPTNKDITLFQNNHPDAHCDKFGMYINFTHYMAVNNIYSNEYEQLLPLCGLFDNTALLYIPTNYSPDFHLDAVNKYQRIIEECRERGITEYILDFRGNGGGDIGFYINFLTPFVDDVTFTIGPSSQFYKDGIYGFTGGRYAKVIAQYQKLNVKNVKVVMNRYTTSSGEIAVHLCRKKSIEVLGEKSAGAFNSPYADDLEGIGSVQVPWGIIDGINDRYVYPDANMSTN